jgi:hypothetical protein
LPFQRTQCKEKGHNYIWIYILSDVRVYIVVAVRIYILLAVRVYNFNLRYSISRMIPFSSYNDLDDNIRRTSIYC